MSGTIPPTVRMVNEIAVQFRHQPPGAAATAIAHHIERFWDPGMRADLGHHVTAAPESLDPVALAAVTLLDNGLRVAEARQYITRTEE